MSWSDPSINSSRPFTMPQINSISQSTRDVQYQDVPHSNIYSISRSEWRNNQLPLVVGYSVTCVLIGRHMNQSNPMDIPRLTQLPSFTYRSSFNHTCSLQYLCRSGITTRSYTAKSFHNTGRRMIRMIEYLFTCSETIPGRIFTYTIGSSHHRFQVDRYVLIRWHQRSYSNDIQDWTGCHHFLVQTYEHSLDLDSPTVITHRWLKLIKLWWK